MQSIGGRRGLKQMAFSLLNLAVLKKSRRKPEVGDTFALLPSDGLYLYGRVIATDCQIGPMKNCILIYIYRPRSSNKESIPELFRGQLLIPPLMTNALPWSRGYFEVLKNQPLQPIDKLPQHCFKDTFGRYYDEYNNLLSEPVEPVAQWGLASFRVVDDEVSKALGIPLAPE